VLLRLLSCTASRLMCFANARPLPFTPTNHLYVADHLPCTCQAGVSPLVCVEVRAVLVHGHLANDCTLTQLNHQIHQHLGQVRDTQGGLSD
jgi:hypothetical protein